MKFLGIMRDSIREAVDLKAFYFMVTVSVLLALLFACISLTPVSGKDGIEQMVTQFPPGANLGMRDLYPVFYTVDDFETTEQANEPWLSTYVFTLNAVDNQEAPGMFRSAVALSEINDREDLSKVNLKATLMRLMSKLSDVTPEKMEEFVRAQLSEGCRFDVKEVRLLSQRPNEAKFHVEVRGTKETFPIWPHTVNVLFGAYKTEKAALAPGILVYSIEDYLVGFFGAAVAMLVSTIITAFFIPNMLRKGTIDLLISKPISRPTLLIFKYLGGLAFMFLNTAVVVVALWLALGQRTGVWTPGFLLTIFIFTFEFAIFYAVSTLFAVLTRSPIVAILATCFAWVIFSAVGWGYRGMNALRDEKPRPLPEWSFVTIDVLHFVTPRIKDLDLLTTKVVMSGNLQLNTFQKKAVEKNFATVSWGESIGASLAFIAVMLGLASWRFSTRDY